MLNNFDAFLDTKDYKLKNKTKLQSQDENPFPRKYHLKFAFHDI